MENQNHHGHIAKKKRVGFAAMDPEKRLKAAKAGGKMSAISRREEKVKTKSRH